MVCAGRRDVRAACRGLAAIDAAGDRTQLADGGVEAADPLVHFDGILGMHRVLQVDGVSGQAAGQLLHAVGGMFQIVVDGFHAFVDDQDPFSSTACLSRTLARADYSNSLAIPQARQRHSRYTLIQGNGCGAYLWSASECACSN